MHRINSAAKHTTCLYSRENKQGMNLSEVRMWMILKSSEYRFRRQQTIGNYIADFASISHKIVIEMDGISHEEPDLYEQHWEQFICAQGYKILRFIGMMPYPTDLIYEFVWGKIGELELSGEKVIKVLIEG